MHLWANSKWKEFLHVLYLWKTAAFSLPLVFLKHLVLYANKSTYDKYSYLLKTINEQEKW